MPPGPILVPLGLSTEPQVTCPPTSVSNPGQGFQYQRPKHQLSAADMSDLHGGAPQQESPRELYRKGTTPSDPDWLDSPCRASPPAPTATPPRPPRRKEQRWPTSPGRSRWTRSGGRNQMLLEGRRGLPQQLGQEKAGASRGITGCPPQRPAADDFRTRGVGHKQSGNPKPREGGRKSPHHFLLDFPLPGPLGGPGAQAAGAGRGETEQLRDGDEALLRMDSYTQGVHPPTLQQGRLPGPGEDHRPEDRTWGPETAVKSQNKEPPGPLRGARKCRLESLRLGDRAGGCCAGT